MVRVVIFIVNQLTSAVDFTGKGRGRQVIAVARTADLVLMMLDAGKGEIQKLVQFYVKSICY